MATLYQAASSSSPEVSTEGRPLGNAASLVQDRLAHVEPPRRFGTSDITRLESALPPLSSGSPARARTAPATTPLAVALAWALREVAGELRHWAGLVLRETPPSPDPD